MAGLSPEMQFLQSLKGESEYTPEAPVVQPSYAPDEDDEEDYDPSNVVSGNKAQSHSASSTPALQQQPAHRAGKSSRFKGGFEIDEEDEEDSAERPNVAAGNGAYSISGPVDTTPSISMATTISHANKLGVPTPSYLDTRTSVTPSMDKSPQPSTLAMQSVEEPSSATAPLFRRARLPEDRVGILEDRISEDPRGDIDAWLELIAEYRNQNNFNQAREVYQRFFRVYPSAVSHSRSDKLSLLSR
jgi:cleavage stimulation factor subunit 3